MNSNQPLVKVTLHGFLGKRFGRVHRYHVSTPAEAYRALCATLRGFERAFCRFPHQFAMVSDGEPLVDAKHTALTVTKSLHVVPMCKGSGKAFKLIAGVIITAIGLYTGAEWAIRFGMGLAMAGVADMLTKTPDLAVANIKQDSEKVESYYFRGPQNVTTQGVPIPVLYGDVFAGSVVLSAGIRTYQMQGDPPPPVPPNTAPAPIDESNLVPIDPMGINGGNWRAFKTSGGMMGYGWEG